MRPMARKRPGAAAGAVALAALVAGCGEGAAPTARVEPSAPAAAGEMPAFSIPRFTDVTANSGLDMIMVSGHAPASQILEVKGGGLALIDYDNDGDLDVFVPNGATMDSPTRGPGSRLWENLGGLRFADATRKAGLNWAGWGTGVAVGDVNGDGFDDLFISAYGPGALLLNTGDGGFRDATADSGLVDPRWGTGCAFGDVDGDGDLDLYVAHYVEFHIDRPPPPDTFKGVKVFGGPLGLPAQGDALYGNRGDGTFEDVTAASGIGAAPSSYGLGALILDIDRDGRQEILVGNDSQPNFLFDDPWDAPGAAPGGQGAAGGATTHAPAGGWSRPLADRGVASGIATDKDGRAQATMGIAIADVDGNGLPDVFTTNFASDTNTLHVNRDGRFFEDRTAQYGLGAVSRPFLKWAALFDDFDADGDEDLLVVNGHVYPQATMETMDSEARQPPLLFAREGPRFERVTDPAAGAWLAGKHVDRSAVLGDLDGDGDMDIVIGELNGPLRVLRNDAGPDGGLGNHWLIVELADDRPGARNRRGLGSCVELTVGGVTRTRWIVSGGSFLSASEAVAHFVVPKAQIEGAGGTASARLTVTWPDGTQQQLDSPALDQRLRVVHSP